MKKVLILLFAVTLALGVFAQDSATNKMSPNQNHEGVIMKDGKLLMMKNGQTTQLTSDLTLDNGTVVLADGSVKTKDGSTTTLKEGDYVSLDGTKMGNVNNWQKDHKDHKDHLSKDPTATDKLKSDSGK